MSGSLELPFLLLSLDDAPQEIFRKLSLNIQEILVPSQEKSIKYRVFLFCEEIAGRNFMSYSCDCPSFRLRLLSKARKEGAPISIRDNHKGVVVFKSWNDTKDFRCKHVKKVIGGPI